MPKSDPEYERGFSDGFNLQQAKLDELRSQIKQQSEVEAALAELREMYPNEFVAIETEVIQKPDGTVDSFVQVSAYPQENRPLNWTVGESGESITEAMAAVRKWYEESR